MSNGTSSTQQEQMRQHARYNNKRVNGNLKTNSGSLLSPEKSPNKPFNSGLSSPKPIKKIFDSSDDEENPGTSSSFGIPDATPGPSSSYGHNGKNKSDEDSRKKFYIVQNAKDSHNSVKSKKANSPRRKDSDMPSEMFRTDFIHRLKQEDSDSDDEPSLVKMVENWRQEWSQGVQMPLSDNVPCYKFLNEDCRNRRPLKKNQYKRSPKLVSQTDKKYVSNKAHIKAPRAPIYHYLIDSADEAWLITFNKRKNLKKLPQISNKEFLEVMDSLEIEAYKGIHAELLGPLCSPCIKGEGDDDTACDICRSPEWDKDDEIVFCDGCNVGVHQSCYGIDKLPDDEWLCKACTLCYGQSPSCLFCPNRLGALKCTQSGKEFAHVACALWLPEVRFGDVDLREPITHVSCIPEERWQLKCSVCDTKQGACIQCSVKNCTVAFHVSCAQRSGFKMQIENDETEKTDKVSRYNSRKNKQANSPRFKKNCDSVRMVSFCKKHSQDEDNQKNPIKKDKSSDIQRRELSELEEDFFHYVSCDEIAVHLKIPHLIVNDIYEYWKIKRSLNKNKQLIQEPIDVKIIPDWCKELPNPTSNNHKIDVNEPSLHPRYIGSGVLQRNYERSRKVRLNLEKARNLSYMVMKREKIKKDELDAEEEIFTRAADRLNSNSVPISARALNSLRDSLGSSKYGNSSNGLDEIMAMEPIDESTIARQTSPDFKQPMSIRVPKKSSEATRGHLNTSFNVPSPQAPSRRLTNSFKMDETPNQLSRRTRPKVENDFLSSDDSDVRSSRSKSISSKASEENHEDLRPLRTRSNKEYSHFVNGLDKITEDPVKGDRKRRNGQRLSEIQPTPMKKANLNVSLPTLRSRR